ncbi:MAG TPA: hypothetical protein VJQ43_06560 [Thermoplasmata archaeon]|nr:hypothetical protein [Thermoplasmata archaeon]
MRGARAPPRMGARDVVATGATLLLVLGLLAYGIPVAPSALARPAPPGAGPSPAEPTPLGPRATGPGALGASARMIVSTQDPASVPNDGVATNLTAFPSSSYPARSSFQTGAEEVIGGYEAVFGIFTNDQTAPVAFFEIFTNTTDQVVRLSYWPSLPVSPGASYDFRLEETSGTVWTLTVNGAPFGGSGTNASFDFGAISSSWIGGIGFSEIAIYSTTSTVPTSFVATTALYVHRPIAGWYLPRNGTATYLGPPGAAWGVEGRTALPDLAPGEVVSGTSLAAVQNTSRLWTTGPVPVHVEVVPAAASVPGLGAVPVDVNVTDPGGAAIGGVPVYVGDTLGGNASPSTVLTAVSGVGATILTAPNESASSSDTVVAVVTILGFFGQSTAPLTVTASLQVRIVPSPTTLTLPPGAAGTITFQTVASDGRPFGGVSLTLAALADAGTNDTALGAALSLTPDAGTTDGAGNFQVVVSAPPVGGTYGIKASVTSLGAWGHATVHVTVRPPPPTFWQRYGGTVVLPVGGAVTAAALAIALFVIMRRRREKRPPLPEMDLRRLREDRGGEHERSAAPGGSVSRRPPASGTP